MKSQSSLLTSRRGMLLTFLCVAAVVLGAIAIFAIYRSVVFDTSVSRVITTTGVGPAPVLGIVIDSNMKVVFVEKGGAADKSGIKIGDTLIRINSKRVKQPKAAREVFYKNSAQKSKLVILRDGKEMTIEIRPAKPVARAGQATPTPAPPDMAYF